MKKIISLIAVAFLLVQFTSCKKGDKAVGVETIKNDGIINFITGNVSIVIDDKTVKANVGDNVTQGMTIITAAKSVVDIYFAGGSVVRILENSSVVMQELVKTLVNNKELTELYVKKGKVFTLVARKLIDNEKFNVRTSTLVAAVRGTEFLVDEENGKSRISCVEGQVAVKDALEKDSSFVNVDNGKAANAEPGKAITVDELTKEEMDNIRRIKNDIRPIREDIKRRFEETDTQKNMDEAASKEETKKSETKGSDPKKSTDEAFKDAHDFEAIGSEAQKRMAEPSDTLKKGMNKSLEAEKAMNDFFGN